MDTKTLTCVLMLRKVIAILILLSTFSCQNNGDIGVLFGQWAVDKVTIDGQIQPLYPCERVFFRFHGEIVVLNLIVDPHVNDFSYVGMWTRTAHTLTFDFNHRLHEDGATGKIPPSLLIPGQAVTTFTILEETNKKLVISHQERLSPESKLPPQLVTFYLRKIY